MIPKDPEETSQSRVPPLEGATQTSGLIAYQAIQKALAPISSFFGLGCVIIMQHQSNIKVTSKCCGLIQKVLP
jgi:hypothetical protein